VAGIYDDERVVDPCGLLLPELFAQSCSRSRTVDAQPGESRVAHRSVDAVLGDRVLALESAHGCIRVTPEDAVLASRIETECIQAGLQRAHVVPTKGRAAEIEGAVAQAPRRFDQLFPSVRSDYPVDQDVALLLERANRFLRLAPEPSGFLSDLESERSQPVLDIGDALIPVALPDQFHHRVASR
jgi:hypothetical protein